MSLNPPIPKISLFFATLLIPVLFGVGCNLAPVGFQNTNKNMNSVTFTDQNRNVAVNDGDADLDNTSMDTSDWQTYRNEEYGFEVKYPPYATAEKLSASGTVGSGLSSVVITHISYFPSASKYPHTLGVHYLAESPQAVVDDITLFDAELFPTSQETVTFNGVDRVQITGPTAELPQLLQIIPFEDGTLLLRGIDDKDSHPEHRDIMNSFRFLDPSSSWVIYKNQSETHPFNIRYPENWKIVDEISGNAINRENAVFISGKLVGCDCSLWVQIPGSSNPDEYRIVNEKEIQINNNHTTAKYLILQNINDSYLLNHHIQFIHPLSKEPGEIIFSYRQNNNFDHSSFISAVLENFTLKASE